MNDSIRWQMSTTTMMMMIMMMMMMMIMSVNDCDGNIINMVTS